MDDRESLLQKDVKNCIVARWTWNGPFRLNFFV